MRTIILLVLVVYSTSVNSNEKYHAGPKVSTQFGTVRGSYDTAINGREFEAYSKIPFAEPPVGLNRFNVIIK